MFPDLLSTHILQQDHWQEHAQAVLLPVRKSKQLKHAETLELKSSAQLSSAMVTALIPRSPIASDHSNLKQPFW